MRKPPAYSKFVINNHILRILPLILSLTISYKGDSQYIAAGNDLSLTLCNNGTVRACGDNFDGQLGDSTLIAKKTPIEVPNISDIIAVATGDNHSIYLKNNGRAYAVGWGSSGQLGDSTYVSRSIPRIVPGLTNITAISGGGYFSLFLRSDSTVWSCGANQFGQLGNFTTSGTNIPGKITTLSNIVAISGGSGHSLFLKSDGTVWACGENNLGQLGDSSGSNKSIPVKVHGLTGVVAIAAGYQFSMFLKNDGTVWTCGRNDFGQLALGTTDAGAHLVPVKSIYLSNVSKITAGDYHSLFLKADGSVWACGNNDYGKLGDGTHIHKNIPVRLSSITGIVEMQGGWGHSLFLKNDGSVLSCGNNALGALGNDTIGTLNPFPKPMNTCITGNPHGVAGVAFADLNNNCNKDAHEAVLYNRAFLINPGNIIVQTANSGSWYLDSLPAGTYTITTDTSGNWLPTCGITQNFTVQFPDSFTPAPGFGFLPTQTCPAPEVSIYMPRMRAGFSNQSIWMQACNLYNGTDVLRNAYVVVDLDPAITLQSSPYTYTSLGNNSYRFDLGNLNITDCKFFWALCSVNANAMLGKTLCMSAHLFPADTCVFDTVTSPPSAGVSPCSLPWDNSNITVAGWCNNDSIFFRVANTGNPGTADMQCFSAVRLYVDGHWMLSDSVRLNGGDSTLFAFAGDGKTWRLEVDQHPLHPGASWPNATVEACGNILNWTPNLVNILPLDDADPVVDIYCGIVTASHDPNQKTGYPVGLDQQHFISANQPLQYTVEFQNTGTDTAFTIVIRDTLDSDLEIFSVKPGVSSHAYKFRMYGTRILEWTLENILLPDSNTNEPLSHGFVTYTVNQNKDLPAGAAILNRAGIYFDFNSPVITNTTLHTLHNNIVSGITEKPSMVYGNLVSIIPNPFSSSANVIINTEQYGLANLDFRVFDLTGHEMFSTRLKTNQTAIDRSHMAAGIYFYNVFSNNKVVDKGRFVVID